MQTNKQTNMLISILCHCYHRKEGEQSNSSSVNLIRQSNGFRVTSIAASQHHGVAFIAGVEVDNKGVEMITMDQPSKKI